MDIGQKNLFYEPRDIDDKPPGHRAYVTHSHIDEQQISINKLNRRVLDSPKGEMKGIKLA